MMTPFVILPDYKRARMCVSMNVYLYVHADNRIKTENVDGMLFICVLFIQDGCIWEPQKDTQSSSYWYLSHVNSFREVDCGPTW